jgi:hypothetical protein
MQWPLRDDLGNFGIGKRSRDDATSADRVDAGADDVVEGFVLEVVLRRRNGNRQ